MLNSKKYFRILTLTKYYIRFLFLLSFLIALPFYIKSNELYFPSHLEEGYRERAFARSVFIPKDSLKRAINRDANRASLMSALLPGLGQVYNRKYWKVPIIYAAIGGIGYFALGFQNDYQKYHNELLYRYANNLQINSYPDYTNDNLITLKNQSKKYRDMCFIGMGIFYVLNIIDANVDAHLKKFDVSDNLSLNISPKSFYCANSTFGVAGGVGLTLSFK